MQGGGAVTCGMEAQGATTTFACGKAWPMPVTARSGDKIPVQASGNVVRRAIFQKSDPSRQKSGRFGPSFLTGYSKATPSGS